jgi:hypothetical protein
MDAGQVGALLALELAAGLGMERGLWFLRRDGATQVSAESDAPGIRKRWAAECKRLGLTVLPAPWERKAVQRTVEAVDKWAKSDAQDS